MPAASSSVHDPSATLAVHCGNGFDARFEPLSKYSLEPIQCRPLSLGADMRRREFISLLGGTAAAWPLAAQAQRPAQLVRRIGMLSGFAEDRLVESELLRTLSQLGWDNGRNVVPAFNV